MSRVLLNLSLLIPHYWSKIFLNFLPSTLWIMSFSSLSGGNRYYPWPCEQWALSSNPFRRMFPHAWVISSMLMLSALWWMMKRHPLQSSGCLSLHSSLLCGVCPVNSYHLGLPGLSALFPHLKECAGFHLNSPSWTMAWKLSLGSKQEKSQGSSHWFLISQGSFYFLKSSVLTIVVPFHIYIYFFFFQLFQFVGKSSSSYFTLGISNTWELTILFEIFLCSLPSYKGLRTGH